MIKKLTIALALFVLAFNVQGNAQTLKGDPWIFQAYQELYNRKPSAWELNINNYNSGSWNNYNELKNYVKEFQSSISSKGFTISTGAIKNDKVPVGFLQNGKLVAIDLVSVDGGKVVAAGGGNVVAAGGGNVVAAGGGNVITIGGANFQIPANTAGVSFGGRYTTQSLGTTIVPVSGKGALIIK